jgi:hypothetical protein
VFVHELDKLVYYFEIYVVSVRKHFRCHHTLRIDDFAQDFNVVVVRRLTL